MRFEREQEEGWTEGARVVSQKVEREKGEL